MPLRPTSILVTDAVVTAQHLLLTDTIATAQPNEIRPGANATRTLTCQDPFVHFSYRPNILVIDACDGVLGGSTASGANPTNVVLPRALAHGAKGSGYLGLSKDAISSLAVVRVFI